MSRHRNRRLKNLTLVTGLFLLGLVGVIFLIDLPKNTANTAKASEITLSPVSTQEILTEEEEQLLTEKLVYLDPELEQLFNNPKGITQAQYSDGEVRLTQLYIDQKISLSEFDFGIDILEKNYNLYFEKSLETEAPVDGQI